jgi:hypothetical protein
LGRAGGGWAVRERAAERDRQHGEDLARAERIGAEFGLGPVKTAARYAQAWRAGFFGGFALAIAGLVVGTAFGAADVSYPLGALVSVPAGSAAAVLAGGLLTRVSLRPRAVHRLFWYAGGLAQQDQDEPEPRVIRWAEVDSVTSVFDHESGLVGCRLRAGTGTEIGAGLGYGHAVVAALAAETGNELAGRFVPALVGAYEAGEVVIAGQWRIGRDGLSRVRGNGREVLTSWRDIRGIKYRREGELTIAADGRRRRTIGLSGVPNGMFVARLIEYAAGQNGIPVTGTRHGGSAAELAGGRG